MLTPFPFQQLDVYTATRELAAAVHKAGIGDPELHSAPSALRRRPWTPSTPVRDQATRAAKSTFLNVAEGLPDTNLGVRRRHLAIARNSLCEVAAAVDLAVAIGASVKSAGWCSWGSGSVWRQWLGDCCGGRPPCFKSSRRDSFV